MRWSAGSRNPQLLEGETPGGHASGRFSISPSPAPFRLSEVREQPPHPFALIHSSTTGAMRLRHFEPLKMP